ncbi:MAG: TetR/AcrR family transcriptional regulator [Acidobacteria bacterium]|nr:TetR/AcrR family transcriptional regulator [Acidobacteriota bacterium]
MKKVLKTAYHHGALQEALVDAAAALAAEKGPTGLSLREVARRAGVSQAAPYHHFADKSGLLAAVAERGFTLLDASQAAALDQAGQDPAARLAELGAAYVRFALDRPHFFKVMFRPHLVEHRKYPLLAAVSSRTFERLVDTVRVARLAHGHDDIDPIAVAMLVWAVPHGLAMLYLDGPISAHTSARAIEGLARASTWPLASATLPDLEQHEPQWGV